MPAAPPAMPLPALPPLPAARVLAVGEGFAHGTCHHRFRALTELGCRGDFVETVRQPLPRWRRLWLSLAGRAFRHGIGVIPTPDLGGVNRALIAHAQGGERFDILWLDKALSVARGTLERFRALQPDCRIVGYSPDDMGRRHNLSRQFLDHLPLYDLFFTTKSYNVAELRAAGARRVVFVDNAFDLHDHRPLPVDARTRTRLGGAVGFIGSYEKERAAAIRGLAEAGVEVRVWGNGWRAMGDPPPGLRLEYRPLYGDEYAAALSAFDINLCFLRKANRDLQTTRSVEIPGCGAFMLGERSDEHRRLFEEGREAEFFADPRELGEKVRYYLAHPERRRAIAAAGRRRCLDGGYSNHHRMHAMLGAALRKR